MPMPLWWGKINKHVFNPRALRNGKWNVLTHVGRSSGELHRTPLEAFEVDGTYVFAAIYGARCDWVRNVLADGVATLETGDGLVSLSSPRLIPGGVAREMLNGRTGLPPRFLNVGDYLQMDIAARESTG